MNNIFKNIFALALVGFTVFFFQNELKTFWYRSFNYYFPCKSPITYSLGTFDTEFGMSKEEFLKALSSAEEIWEKPVSKNLFKYDPEGSLKINLIYDIRQESTVQLKSMGIVVENNRASYDALKAKYEALNVEYIRNRNAFESRLETFKIRQKAFEDEVEQVNAQGGADKETSARLNAERKYLNSEITAINGQQANLRVEVSNINALVVSINELAGVLNIDVQKFNTIGTSLGREFDEGVYRSGPEGQQIDIYQFDNRTKLIRVLAHEFGHALGLDHIEDPKAIMYRLNNGINEKLTDSDLVGLKAHCGIK